MSRVLVRKLWRISKEGETVLYEVYTQPQRDRLVFLAFDILWKLSWKSGLEKVLDRWYDARHKTEPVESYLPPGVRMDLWHYDLDVKNNVRIGEVQGE